MKHLKAHINGKVQGVFFRVETKKKAEGLGIFGFIENRDDGSVYLEAEGEESLLKELVQWCHDGGPELATVDEMTEEYSDELKDFEDFSVR